jgi:hypothetical protein
LFRGELRRGAEIPLRPWLFILEGLSARKADQLESLPR